MPPAGFEDRDDHRTACASKQTQGVNNMGEILTAKEVAVMLKLSTRQVYELARDTVNPLPSLRIRTSVRFRRADLDGWITGLVEKKTA